MKNISLFLYIIILCLLVSCDSLPIRLAKENEVRAGLERAIAQLPQSSDFTMIKIVNVEMEPEYRTEIGEPCYYARAEVVVGTALQEITALDLYGGKLQESGWLLHLDQYETTRHLVQGTNLRAVVRTGRPGVDIEGAIDYTRLKSQYRTIIFVGIDYMLPNRYGC